MIKNEWFFSITVAFNTKINNHWGASSIYT
jgi:hypothetical protein